MYFSRIQPWMKLILIYKQMKEGAKEEKVQKEGLIKPNGIQSMAPLDDLER